MSKEKKVPFTRKLLTVLFGGFLAIAVPIANCVDCGVEDPSTFDRERAYANDMYVGPSSVPEWTYMDEGLRYIPYSVAINLKRPSPDGLKLLDEGLFDRPERFGMLPDPMDKHRKLPVGVTVSDDAGYVPMIGLTCSACHIGAIANDDAWTIVPGAPNFMSVGIFFGDMIKSMIATLANPSELDELWEKHSRTKVTHAGSQADPALVSLFPNSYIMPEEIDSREELAAYMTVRVKELLDRASGNDDDSSPPLGTSNPWATTQRLFGVKHAHVDADDMKKTFGTITAPDIWRYGQRKYVFWSQSTNSMLERNIAQGLALLADVDWKEHDTTISIEKLQKIEASNMWIEPPRWPNELLGDVDPVLASRGCKTFINECAGCHHYDDTDDVGSVEYRMFNVGTDFRYCESVIADTGDYASIPDLVAPVTSLVKDKLYDRDGSRMFEIGRLPVEWKTMDCNKLPARGLVGVWASAPYLHNGSVRTLDDLLKPHSKREKKFYVGSIQYDPYKLGFISEKFDYTTLVDTTVKGLSNVGHEFVITDDKERRALIEYMKVHDGRRTCDQIH